MHVYINICVPLFTYVYMYITPQFKPEDIDHRRERGRGGIAYTYTCIHTYVYICLYTYIYVYIPIVYTHVCIYSCAYMYVYIYISFKQKYIDTQRGRGSGGVGDMVSTCTQHCFHLLNHACTRIFHIYLHLYMSHIVKEC